MVGYFSKEKESASGYNLACILTLPQATPRPPHTLPLPPAMRRPPPPRHAAPPRPPSVAAMRPEALTRLDAAHAASIKARSSHGAARPWLCLCAGTASDGDTQLERL